jgi:hypothetical protein
MVMSFFRWLEEDYPAAGAEKTISVKVVDTPAADD